jgi:hypothetical protein
MEGHPGLARSSDSVAQCPQGEGAGAPSTSPGGVDAAYFSSLNAPFDFAEAQRRVRLSVSPESVS